WISNSLSPQEIRERMMDKTSEFQTRMVEYLESVHKGEFMDQTKDEVQNEVSYIASHPEYQDPTQTLPDPPPYPCEHTYNDNCHTCTKSKIWWETFKKTVNDLLLKSNIHTCGDHCKVKGRCKARFPRPIISETKIDSKTGYIEMRKGESRLNTYTPALTYLLRSNSDVTSLLSGTALKAVIAYVTDYITKTPLKTYTIFQTVKDVFDRKSTMLGGDMKDQEKARRLLTSIVNSLTVKMEIGAPMASAYLLGNPDHYTSHRFQTVFWRSYVSEVLKSWEDIELDKLTDDNKITDKEKVVVRKTKDGYTPYSLVMDYMYRAEEYEDISLYDWVCLSRKQIIPKSIKKDLINQDFKDDSDDLQSNTENEDVNEINIGQGYKVENDQGHKTNRNRTDPRRLTFLLEHPQHNSHYITLVKKGFALVPNFIGGSLPRRDGGNREFYCTTMMTLFKPWRSGKDLRTPDQSWDDALNDFQFTPRQQQLMSFFNIQYECYDARDDYSRQMKAGLIPGLTNIMNGTILDQMGAYIDQTDEMGIYDDYTEHLDATEYSQIGRQTARRIKQMEEMHSILNGAGWLDKCFDIRPLVPPKDAELIQRRNRQEWLDIIQSKRNLILQEKDKHRQSNIQNGTSVENGRYKWSEVKLVDQSYLLHDYHSSKPDVAKMQHEVIKQFSLRPDQERAFRIIGNHAS
ncbi:hypothetical protein NEOLEDRAFT_1018916, partial [Neolentinus lepideus HHB14362 ss-1]